MTEPAPLRFALEPVDLDYVGRAPKTLTFTAEITGDADAIWHELADDAGTWAQWFPQVASASYASDGEPGLGTRRLVALQGRVARFVETIIAFEPGRRYAWRVDSCSAPVFGALVEDWALEPAGDGTRTRITWTFAYRPRLLFKLAAPLAPRAMRRSFLQATSNLETRLGGGRT